MVNNNVTLIGRITKDLELKKTNSGTSVLSFTLAVDRFKEGTDFIQCQVWRQSAEYLYQYASKGSLIAINGSISTRSYEGQNGKVYVTEVMADNVKILQSKSEPKKEEIYQPTLTGGDRFTQADINATNFEIDSDNLPFY